MNRFTRYDATAERGFTLIEVMVVVIVLGFLAGLVAPRVFGRVAEARSTTAASQIELLSVALDNYRLDNGTYPTTSQGLEALRTRPSTQPRPPDWRGPYLRKSVPLDPWNRPYVYRYPGDADRTAFELISYGRDGERGGDGEDADIASWE